MLERMLAKPVDAVFEKVEGVSAGRASEVRKERRRLTRLQVRWPVSFRGVPLASGVRATTLNVSSDGFYCWSPIRLEPGAVLTCALEIPTHACDVLNGALLLECSVRVVRIDSTDAEGQLGIACQIVDYHLVREIPGCDQDTN